MSIWKYRISSNQIIFKLLNHTNPRAGAKQMSFEKMHCREKLNSVNIEIKQRYNTKL